MQPTESPRKCPREGVQVEHKGLWMPVLGPAVTQHKGFLWPICTSTASSLHSSHEFLGICPGGAGRAKVFPHYCFRKGSESDYHLKSNSSSCKQSALSTAKPCSLHCHCLSLHVQGMRQIRVGAEGTGMRMAHTSWLLVALGSQWPSEVIFGNGCFTLGSCVSRFCLPRFLCPTPAGFHSQLRRSWAPVEPHALLEPPGSVVYSQGVISAHKLPKAVPSMEHWGLLQTYCTHRQVSFWVGKFVYLPGSHLSPLSPLLWGTQLSASSPGGSPQVCWALCISSQAEGGWGTDLWELTDLIFAMLEPKCRQAWRAASILCSSCSSLIPKSFSWLTWITFSFLKYIISMTDINVKCTDEEQKWR